MNNYSEVLTLIENNKIFGAENKEQAWIILAMQSWFELSSEQRENLTKYLTSKIVK